MVKRKEKKGTLVHTRGQNRTVCFCRRELRAGCVRVPAAVQAGGIRGFITVTWKLLGKEFQMH